MREYVPFNEGAGKGNEDGGSKCASAAVGIVSITEAVLDAAIFKAVDEDALGVVDDGE